MNFSASLSDFQKALQKTLPAMPRKSTLPILEHLFFSVKDNSLLIIATDQDITIRTSIPVEVEQPGAVLVPGKRINDIAKALGEKGTLSFSTNEENFDILIRTSFGKYAMKGLSPDEFLDIPQLFESDNPNIAAMAADEFSTVKQRRAIIEKNEMVKIAEKTVFAVSTDEYRPAMTGVLFQMKDDFINAVSTDSFRLVKVVTEYMENELQGNLDVIIPARTIELLKKVDNDVVMTMIDRVGKLTHIRFDFGETTLISRVIDEKFPPYESVIPLNNELILIINHKEILSSIRRVAIFTSNISHQIKIHVENDTLSILGEDEEYGTQANEVITCDYNSDTPLEVAFNYKYLEEALQNMDLVEEDENIALTFSESNKPVLIKPSADGEKLLMLVMPVRI